MRLISQDGMIDVPYEHGSLCQGFIKGEEHLIYTISYYNYSSQKGTKLAEYSSKTKVLKVMEMLRASYVNNECYKSLCSGIVIPLPNNSDDMKEKTVATRAFRATTIFQFPKDEDVEV